MMAALQLAGQKLEKQIKENNSKGWFQLIKNDPRAVKAGYFAVICGIGTSILLFSKSSLPAPIIVPVTLLVTVDIWALAYILPGLCQKETYNYLINLKHKV